jgi:hypothetical protein
MQPRSLVYHCLSLRAFLLFIKTLKEVSLVDMATVGRKMKHKVNYFHVREEESDLVV